MKIEITLEKALLQALLKFAGNKDIRYYLNGIAIETGNQGARLIATNGHSLALAKVDGVFASTSEAVIIPRAMLEKLRTKRKDSPHITLTIEGESCPYALRLVDADDIREAPSLDGRFPDWQRVIPREFSGESAQLNPYILLSCAEAARLLDHTSGQIAVSHNGNGAALVEFTGRNDIIAVIMPMNVKPSYRAPDWLGDELNDQASWARSVPLDAPVWRGKDSEMKGRFQPTTVGNMVRDPSGGYVCYWDYEEQHKLLRECFRAIDELLTKRPMQAGLICGSTTLGNLLNDLRAATRDMLPNSRFIPQTEADKADQARYQIVLEALEARGQLAALAGAE